MRGSRFKGAGKMSYGNGKSRKRKRPSNKIEVFQGNESEICQHFRRHPGTGGNLYTGGVWLPITGWFEVDFIWE